MKTVRATAPGKLVLTGEYVVLTGATALGVALNRRSISTVQAASGDVGQVSCPGLDDTTHSLSLGEGGIWQTQEDLPLVNAAFELVPMIGAIKGQLDTTAFHDPATQRKLGLGSSASLAVSFLGALSRLAGREGGLEDAQRLHRAFQGGRGSGIDVATCYSGGLVEYSIDAPCEPRPHDWPDDLLIAVYWTGHCASTTGHIERFLARPKSGAANAALSSASAAAAQALRKQNGFFDAMVEYASCLKRFDREMSLGIYDAGHEQLRLAAERLPLAYKPCGAGGGDIGIAISMDDEALQKFDEVASRTGATRLDVGIDRAGLLVEEGGT